jgi:PAS domain S-box-containing protein
MHDFVMAAPDGTREDLFPRHRLIVRPAIAAVIIGVAYYVGARLGFALTFQPHPVSTLWPPNSILFAALLLAPTRWWWFLLLAVFPAHLFVEVNAGVPLSMILCWFVSNCSEALIGATFVRFMIHEHPRLDSTYQVSVFIVAALVGPFLSSFLDSFFVMLNRFGDSGYWDVFRMRFFSNVLAAVTVAPLILTWATGGFRSRSTPLSRYIEAAILGIALLLVSIISFDAQRAGQSNVPVLLYLPLPLLLWAAIRFGPRGASTSLVAVSLFAIWGAIHGFGPFATRSPEINALQVQLFLIFASMPLLFLAAVIKERERAEALAHQKEERLEMALEAAQMGTWDWQIADNTLNWSTETKRLFGRSPLSELSQEQVLSMLHPDDRQLVKEAVNRALVQAAPYEQEFRIYQPDGSTLWARGKGKVICDENGKAIRMAGLVTDVTDAKRAEEALKESEARLARTEAFSLVMIAHLGLDGRWLKVPESLCDLLGYTEKELLAVSFQDVTHPADVQASWEARQRLIRGETKSVEIENRYINRTGKIIWVYINYSVVEDAKGQPVHFLTYIKDITRQKLAEEALRESEDRYRNIIESQSEMICRFLPDTTLTYVNDAYCRCFGKSREELIGVPFVELIPEAIRERTKRGIESLVRNPRTETREHEVLLPDGSIGWQQWINHAIPGPDGKTVELQAIGRDITNVRLASIALTQSEEKLRRSHRQISALAGKLITVQETERRRIARQLHDDLNQKIATLSLMIAKFKKKLPASTAYLPSELAQIEDQINDLTTDVRRISHRLHPVVLEHLGLVAGLEAYVNEFRIEEGIEVGVKAFVGDDKIPLELSVCLYRVAVEALRNVARHSGARRAGILLRKENGWIELQVSDSGQGFDAEATAKGEGLGLVSMDERVKLLRGTFEVQSRPGVGTTISARVPLAVSYESK